MIMIVFYIFMAFIALLAVGSAACYWFFRGIKLDGGEELEEGQSYPIPDKYIGTTNSLVADEIGQCPPPRHLYYDPSDTVHPYPSTQERIDQIRSRLIAARKDPGDIHLPSAIKRPLSSMTEQEAEKCHVSGLWYTMQRTNTWHAQFYYLHQVKAMLDLGFDVFNSQK